MAVGSCAETTPASPKREPADGRAALASTAHVLVLSLAWASTADAATWRLPGPNRPPAGESSTHLLHETAGLAYRVRVYGGSTPCPGRELPGDSAEMLSIDGYLDGSGADVLQISLSRGRSTVCAYDEAASLMASKTVRTNPEHDRLRSTATRQEDAPKDDALVTATGYVRRQGVPRDAAGRLTEAEQHVKEITVSAIPDSQRWRRIPPPESAPHTGSVSVYTARFREAITVDGAFGAASRLRLCGYLTAERQILGSIRTRIVASARTPTHSSADALPVRRNRHHGRLRLRRGAATANTRVQQRGATAARGQTRNEHPGPSKEGPCVALGPQP
jgi:hypothetical protein